MILSARSLLIFGEIKMKTKASPMILMDEPSLCLSSDEQLVSDEPILRLQRNIFLSPSAELEIDHPEVIRLLYCEASENVLEGLYPMDVGSKFDSSVRPTYGDGMSCPSISVFLESRTRMPQAGRAIGCEPIGILFRSGSSSDVLQETYSLTAARMDRKESLHVFGLQRILASCSLIFSAGQSQGRLVFHQMEL